MNVTLVSGVDPTGTQAGGTRTYVLGLAERLHARGVSVSLVARDGDSAKVPGVGYVRIRSGPSSVNFLLRLAASAPGLPIPADSIIHVQRPDDLVPFTLAKRRNPAVCTLHGIPAIAVRRRRGRSMGAMYRSLESIGLRRVDRLIAVNGSTARWYASRYPRLAGLLSVVPVGVDSERFRPLDRDEARARFRVRRPHVLVYAGRLSPEKRIDAILRALPGLPEVELLVAGDGPERSRLEDSAAGLAVRFLGAVPHEEMPWLLSAASLFVLPSEFEGLPTAAVEALACGVPVVAAPVGGLTDLIVPGRTGWLVPDLALLGPTIRDALGEAEGMRDACVAAASPYGWDGVVDRVLAVYREAEGPS